MAGVKRGKGRGSGNLGALLPPPSRTVSRPNSLSLPFRTPATQAKDCHPQSFRFFLKTWLDEIIWLSFTVQYCFPRFRFVCTELCFADLSSSNLSCNLCLWYYDQLVHFNKEINAKVYRHSLWKYYERFHCSFEWHLTPHVTLSVYRNLYKADTLYYSGHYSISRGLCPLNTGRFHSTDQRLTGLWNTDSVLSSQNTWTLRMNRRDAI